MPQPSELAECLTQEEIALLATVFGPGQRFYVPSSTANAERLEVILGLTATSNLIHHFGGQIIYLPGLPPPTGQRREPTLEQVKRLSATHSASQIARKHGCSVRNVFSKRREIRRRESEGLPLETPRTGRKHLNLKNARARQRRANRCTEPASLRRNAEELQTDD